MSQTECANCYRLGELYGGGFMWCSVECAQEHSIAEHETASAKRIEETEGRLEWVTAWALRALDAMARVAPDAPRFNELEDDWDQFSYREVSWFRERAARLTKDPVSHE